MWKRRAKKRPDKEEILLTAQGTSPETPKEGDREAASPELELQNMSGIITELSEEAETLPKREELGDPLESAVGNEEAAQESPVEASAMLPEAAAAELPDLSEEAPKAREEIEPSNEDGESEDAKRSPIPVTMPKADSVTIPFQARKEKKKHKKLIIFLFLLAFTVLAGTVAVYFYFRETPAEEVNLSISEMTMRAGEVFPLHYEIVPTGADDDLTWRSSAPYVATVENGVVTAVGEGSCTITVTADSGAKDMCHITVRQPIMEEEQAIFGEWKLYATSDLGRIKYYYGSAYTLKFYSDRTGFLAENDESSEFEWEYEETVNGYASYTVYMEDGRTITMEYNTNTGNVMNNTLSLRFSDELLWVFLKK